MRVFLYVPCGHLLGKDWPLGSRLWCLTVRFSLAHWYPGSGVILDCIDSWSLHPALLFFIGGSVLGAFVIVSSQHVNWFDCFAVMIYFICKEASTRAKVCVLRTTEGLCPCLIMQHLVSLLVLQSSRRGRASGLLYLSSCFPVAVNFLSHLLAGRMLICSVWLWRFTYCHMILK